MHLNERSSLHRRSKQSCLRESLHLKIQRANAILLDWKRLDMNSMMYICLQFYSTALRLIDICRLEPGISYRANHSQPRSGWRTYDHLESRRCVTAGGYLFSAVISCTGYTRLASDAKNMITPTPTRAAKPMMADSHACLSLKANTTIRMPKRFRKNPNMNAPKLKVP